MTSEHSNLDFIYVDYDQVHGKRRREIIIKHPEVKKYFGNYPLSALYICLIVLFQFSMATTTLGLPYWGIPIMAFCIGAFAHHAQYVMIHECAHNMVFKSPTANKWIGIVCDLCLAFPGAMGFRQYHLIHHTNLGEHDYDADLVSFEEGRLIGNSWWRKALWLAFFMVSQGLLRPTRLKKNIKMWNKWIALNFVIVFAVDGIILFYFGFKPLLYLAFSTFFALGLHPLGGRWIQEHYIHDELQETFSYYGPLNKLTFNMGYHNEHHDLFMVPWIHLPKIKKLAPEYYDNLIYHTSWTRVILNFIFSPKMHPFRRMVHPSLEAPNALSFEGKRSI